MKRVRVLSVAVALVAAGGMIGVASAVPVSASPVVTTAAVGLKSSVNPSVFGQQTVLTAVVTDPAVPAASISGVVTFSDGASVLGTVAVVNAKATLATRTLATGTHALTASFAPTGGGAALLSAPVLQTVSSSATSIVVATSNATANYGAAGNVTASVKAVAPGRGVPTGSVDFLIDGGWYWNAPLDANGKAVLPLSFVYPAYYPGTYSITASYSGDGNFDPSATANPVAQTLVGISAPPVTMVTTSASGQPHFSPNAFTMSSANPVGCNVSITNTTSTSIALVYGTPGAWKRLPNGVIAPGATGGVGVGLANFTGYFSAVGADNYVKVRCN